MLVAMLLCPLTIALPVLQGLTRITISPRIRGEFFGHLISNDLVDDSAVGIASYNTWRRVGNEGGVLILGLGCTLSVVEEYTIATTRGRSILEGLY